MSYLASRLMAKRYLYLSFFCIFTEANHLNYKAMSTTSLILTIIIVILSASFIYFVNKKVKEERTKVLSAQLEHLPNLVKMFERFPITSPKKLTYEIELPRAILTLNYTSTELRASVKGISVDGRSQYSFQSNFDKSADDQFIYDEIERIILSAPSEVLA